MHPNRSVDHPYPTITGREAFTPRRWTPGQAVARRGHPLRHSRPDLPRRPSVCEPTLPNNRQHACGVVNCYRTATGTSPPRRVTGQLKGPSPASPQVTGPFLSGGWGIRTPEGLHPTRFPIACSGVRGSRPTSVCAGQCRLPTKNMPRPTSTDKRELQPKLQPVRSRAGADHAQWRHSLASVCRSVHPVGSAWGNRSEESLQLYNVRHRYYTGSCG